MDPAPPASNRAAVDAVNSVAWFAMDALWMFGLEWPAYAAAVLTVATGLRLLTMGHGRDRGGLLADLGLTCWIGMNTVWMVADLTGREVPLVPAGVVAGLGAVFIAAAAWHSNDVRRLRIVRR